jgi:hypothetical protein
MAFQEMTSFAVPCDHSGACHNILLWHRLKQFMCLHEHAAVNIPTNHRRPRHKVPLGHCVKHLSRPRHLPTPRESVHHGGERHHVPLCHFAEQPLRIFHATDPDERCEHGIPRGHVAPGCPREVRGRGVQVSVREAPGDDGVSGDDVTIRHCIEEAARGRQVPRQNTVSSAFQETTSRCGMASKTRHAAATSPARPRALMRWLSRRRWPAATAAERVHRDRDGMGIAKAPATIFSFLIFFEK